MTPQDYLNYTSALGPMIYSGINNPMSLVPQPVGPNVAANFGGLGGYAAAAGGLYNAAKAGDLGGDIQDKFAAQTGQNVNDLAAAPGFLSKGSKRKREIGIAAANFIPFVGPLVSGVLRGFDTAKESRVAARYLGELLGGVPGLDPGAADMMAHAVRPSGMESLDTGLEAMRQSLGGPIAKLADPLLSKIDPIHIFAKRNEAKRQEEFQAAQKKLKTAEQRGNRSVQKSYDTSTLGLAGQAGAYGQDPRMAYILRILQQGGQPQNVNA